jgi:carboxymethylenebutenolidase
VTHLPRPEGFTAEDLNMSRRALGGLLFAGYALGAGPANAAAITTDLQGVFARDVSIPSAGVQLPGYLAMPENARNRPVVLVVSEIFGVHEYIRDVCRRLAKAGYVAVAPDLFARAGDPSKLTDTAEIIKIVETATNAQVMGDLAATLDWLATQPALGQKNRKFANVKKVGVTGFCWGGAVTWMAAAGLPVKAGVAWYGRLTKPAKGFLSGENRPWPIDVAAGKHAPVLGLYAGKDKGIPLEDVEKMRAALAAAGDKKSQIVVYPEAEHGFHADYRATYREPDARDGWDRLLAWFAKYLK